MLMALHCQGAQLPVFGPEQNPQVNLLQHLKWLACIQGQVVVHAFCLHKASDVQQTYTQAERGHAALDEELTRGYIHNLEVHASQQERVGHYRKTEQAKRDKVSIARSGHCEIV